MAQSWAEIEPGIYGNPELSKQARVISFKQTRLLEAVDPATEFNLGKKSGDKVGFRLVGRISGTADTALLESQKVPFAKPPIYTGTGQVFRRAMATPWTGTREDLDRIDVEEVTIRALRDHAARTHNKVINDALVAGRSFGYIATGTDASPTYTFNTNGTIGTSSTRRFALFDVRKLKLEAVRRNIPPADGNNFFFFGSPTIEDNLFNDVSTNGFVDVSKYAPGGAEGMLNGEIGKVGAIRFVIDNDVISDAVGTGSAFGSGFMLGFEACKELMVYPMHFRVNMNLGGDFGNQKGICWQSLVGYKVPWNFTTHGQGAIIHYSTT